MKTLGVVSAAMASVAAILIMFNCGDRGTKIVPETDFEVHEWGVVTGCADDDSFFVTSRPEYLAQFDLPVIYVHSKSKTPFTASVSFNSGRVLTTYPKADSILNGAEWKNVQFADSLDLYMESGIDDTVPLHSIIPMLNNVDADIMQVGEVKSRVLFYEGIASYRNKVKVIYQLDSLTAWIENQNDYPVYDLSLIVTRDAFSLYSCRGRATKLEPGEGVSIRLIWNENVDLASDLIMQGFTAKEARVFSSIWNTPLCYSLDSGCLANLFYRLPQSEYDNLISLKISPEPTKTIRSLYVLTHLPAESQVDSTSFEIHEWGVMVGCRSNPSYFVTSRPELILQVYVPVIYVHSRDKRPFSAKVTFNNGQPGLTYPLATTRASTIEWNGVQILPRNSLAGSSALSDYVPLGDIIGTLNSVDADVLSYNQSKARFLFYEGESRFSNFVDVTYDIEGMSATLSNRAEYPVYGVIFAATNQADYMFPNIVFGRAPVLEAGQSLTVPLSENASIDLAEDLRSQGFSESEATAFSTLWSGTMLASSNLGGWANLVYRLPQAEYDRLMSLEVTPRPTQAIRSLYVLVHL